MASFLLKKNSQLTSFNGLLFDVLMVLPALWSLTLFIISVENP